MLALKQRQERRERVSLKIHIFDRRSSSGFFDRGGSNRIGRMQLSLFKSFVQITVNLQYLYWNVYCITFYIFMIIFKTHNTVHLQKCAKFFSTSISQWDSLVFQISKRISTSKFYFWQNWQNATEPVQEFCANHCEFAVFVLKCILYYILYIYDYI